MGGSGSGRFYVWDKKTTVEESYTLDSGEIMCNALPWMKERGVHFYFGSLRWLIGEREIGSVGYSLSLTAGRGSGTLKLSYTANGVSVETPIHLQTTRQPKGGFRYWLTCPLMPYGRPCGRRVKKLYLPPGSRYFGCRHCHDLTYKSCQESHKWDRIYATIASELSKGGRRRVSWRNESMRGEKQRLQAGN